MVDIEVRVQKDLQRLIRDKLSKKFNEVIAETKRIILEKYDELSSFVTDPNSKTNPGLYKDDFVKRLDDFNYIEDRVESIEINVPSMETFDFSGRLKVIEAIMNGIAGNYVEMNLEEFTSIFKRSPFSADSKGAEDLANVDIFLIRYNDNIKNIERHLKKEFIKYPFSNVSSFDVLEKGGEFISKNMKTWISKAIEESNKELVTKYKGATL